MAAEMLKMAGTAALCMAVTTAAAIAVTAAAAWLRQRMRRPRNVCGVGQCEGCCGCDVMLRHDGDDAGAGKAADKA